MGEIAPGLVGSSALPKTISPIFLTKAIVRGSLKFVSWKDRKAVAGDLKRYSRSDQESQDISARSIGDEGGLSGHQFCVEKVDFADKKLEIGAQQVYYYVPRQDGGNDVIGRLHRIIYRVTRYLGAINTMKPNQLDDYHSEFIAKFLFAVLLFGICYIAFGYHGEFMPWGRLDPIIALRYISITDQRFFPEFLYFDAQRPFNLIPYYIITKSPFTGSNVWFLYKTILIFLAGLGVFLSLHEILDRKYLLFPSLVSLLFVVYPAASWEKLNQVLLVSQYSIASIFISYYLALVSLRANGWKKSALVTGSFLLGLNGFLAYEVAAPISVGLVLLIFIKNKKESLGKSIKFAILLAMPIAIVTAYKVSLYFAMDYLNQIYPNIRTTFSKAEMSVGLWDVVLKLYHGIQYGIYSAWMHTFSGAISFFSIHTGEWVVIFKWIVITIFIASLVAVLLIFARLIYLKINGKPVPDDQKIYSYSIVIGALFIILGYAPFLPAKYYPLNVLGRVHDYATPGICLVIISTIMLLSTQMKRLKYTFIFIFSGCLILAGTSAYFTMEYSLAQQWKHEKPVWIDVLSRAPKLTRNTVVAIRGYNPSYTSLEVESYYFTIVLASMFHDDTLKLIILPRDYHFGESSDSFVFPTSMDFSEVDISAPENAGALSLELGYYYIPKLRPPIKIINVDKERFLVFDYINGETILNNALSNQNRISGLNNSDTLFTRHFIGKRDIPSLKARIKEDNGFLFFGRALDYWMGKESFIYSSHANINVQIESFHAKEVFLESANLCGSEKIEIKPGKATVCLCGKEIEQGIYEYELKSDALFSAKNDPRELTLRILGAEPAESCR